MDYILYMMSEALNVAIWLGVPGCIMTNVFPGVPRLTMAKRFILSIAAVWLLLIVARFSIHLPIALRIAQLEHRPEWDGVGGNVATLFGGWILGLQSAGAWLLGIWLYRKLRTKANPKLATPPYSEPTPRSPQR